MDFSQDSWLYTTKIILVNLRKITLERMNKKAEECGSVYVDTHRKIIVSHASNASSDCINTLNP